MHGPVFATPTARPMSTTPNTPTGRLPHGRRQVVRAHFLYGYGLSEARLPP